VRLPLLPRQGFRNAHGENKEPLLHSHASLRRLPRGSVALPLLAGRVLTLTGCSEEERPKLRREAVDTFKP
jgi:hypothetical protein